MEPNELFLIPELKISYQ